MSRNKASLVNKASGLIKLLGEDKLSLEIGYSNIEIKVPNTSSLSWQKGEEIFTYFHKKDINWVIKFNGTDLIYRIFL